MSLKVVLLVFTAFTGSYSHAELSCNPLELAGSCSAGWNSSEVHQTLVKIDASAPVADQPQSALKACEAIWEGKKPQAPPAPKMSYETQRILTERLAAFSGRVSERIKFPIKPACRERLKAARSCMQTLAAQLAKETPKAPSMDSEKCLALAQEKMAQSSTYLGLVKDH